MKTRIYAAPAVNGLSKQILYVASQSSTHVTCDQISYQSQGNTDEAYMCTLCDITLHGAVIKG